MRACGGGLVCVFITVGPSTKLYAWAGDMGGHVLN
jgi:hypothetical protein